MEARDEVEIQRAACKRHQPWHQEDCMACQQAEIADRRRRMNGGKVQEKKEDISIRAN